MNKQRITKLIALLTLIVMMLTMLASCKFFKKGASDSQGSQDNQSYQDKSCLHDNGRETIIKNNVEPTCTTMGSYDNAICCTDCGMEFSRKTVKLGMVNHNYIQGQCSVCGSIKENIVREGNYIYFGEYPQTIKADYVTITSTLDNRGYYLGSDGYYYAAVIATPTHSFSKTYFTNGNKAEENELYYFKVEPIRWKILSESDGTAILLCDSVLAYIDYQPSVRYINYKYDTIANGAPSGTKPNNYKYSEVRSWLINEFYNNAFSELQRGMIFTTALSDIDKNLEDKVFILSVSELDKYGTAINKSPSDYSRALGAWGGSWWTRSPHSKMSDMAIEVNVDENNSTSARSTYDATGVVPALQICLNAHADTNTVTENNKKSTCIDAGSYDSVVCCSTCSMELSRETIVLETGDHNYIDGYCSVCGSKALYTRDDGYIYFGEYPQTIKADHVAITETTDSRGYYLGSDGSYYAKIISRPDGSIYTFSTGNRVKAGEVYYFKVEPIRWRILSTDGETALILCDSIIANQHYGYDNNYAESDIRQWLNTIFYEVAFPELQREIIRTTLVDNSAESAGYSYTPHACENTEDRIFLLSYAEVTNSEYGFASEWSTYDIARQVQTSDYSRATGAFMSIDDSYYGIGLWWLRSPVSYSQHYNYARYIINEGYVDSSSFYQGAATSSTHLGIVPAMWIVLDVNVQENQHTHVEAEAIKENIVAPTCTIKGSCDIVVNCSVCGEELSRETVSIDPIGHRFIDCICEYCGSSTNPRFENYVRCDKNGKPNQKGEYILFGEYPQTIKENYVTITYTTDDRGYYLGSDGYYYAAVTATPYGTNYKFTTGTPVFSGEVYYFKVEPIRWRILSVSDGTAFLLCDSIIANQRYDDYSVNYDNSEVRQWLNDTFYETAFTEFQREIICTTLVKNKIYYKVDEDYQYIMGGYNYCLDTEDKIFLLSREEVYDDDYGFSNDMHNDYEDTRKMLTSDYTRANGVFMMTEGALYQYGMGNWLLRSNESTSYLRIVDYYGSPSVGQSSIYVNYLGIVPAMWINLNS